ncbi:MAG: folate-binding protein YgfZ [Candidatus Azotimanducaceae bacterium]|jgi:folate-binding protein YgfZ
MTDMEKLITLNHFGFLSISGKDAKKFLQGYTTCDLEEVLEGESRLGAICTIQGRMLANFRIVAQGDGFILRLNESLIPEVLTFLQKYIVFSKAKLADISQTKHCYGTFDGETSWPASLLESKQDDNKTIVCIGEGRFEIWSDDALDASDDSASWMDAEIGAGYAWVDEISQSEYLPQMFNLHNLKGISFEKGCYLGQEIVARMQFRGKLKKTLHKGEATRDIKNGESILNENQRPVGKVVSAQGSQFLAVIQNKDEENQILDLKLSDDESIKASPLSS